MGEACRDAGVLRLSDGRVVEVDACIAPLLQALNDAGIQTIDSCCGHGKREASIFFAPINRLSLRAQGCCGEPWMVLMQWDGCHPREAPSDA